MSYTGLNLSNDDYNALNDNVYRFVGEMNDDNRSNMDRRDAAISAVQLMNFMAEVAYTSGDRGLAATIVRQRDAHIDLYPQFYGMIYVCFNFYIQLLPYVNRLHLNCFLFVSCFHIRRG